MRAIVKRGILVLVLFLASGYCLLGILATAQLSSYDDPTTERRAYMWLAGSIVLAAAGLWQLVVLLRRHRSENLS